MNKAAQPKIYVAGHRGMVGSALVRNLLAQGIASENLITRSRQELDLTNQLAVHRPKKPQQPKAMTQKTFAKQLMKPNLN